MSSINGFDQKQLRHHVRQEVEALKVEKRYLTMQLKATDDRLAELAKAELLLEGGF